MNYQTKLIHGRLVKRYKRFLADIILDSGELVTAHCTNSGTMKSCLEEGAEVYISPVDNPARKTKYTWEMILIKGNWVGINTSTPNTMVFEWIKRNRIAGLTGYTNVCKEVTFLDSRFDIFAENDFEKCFIEIKNVTLKEGDYALFPDALTVRGQKHLETLIKIKETGIRAVMLYFVQRVDVKYFDAAIEIDPIYAKKLYHAVNMGLEIIPLQVKITPESIEPVVVLPFIKR